MENSKRPFVLVRLLAIGRSLTFMRPLNHRKLASRLELGSLIGKFVLTSLISVLFLTGCTDKEKPIKTEPHIYSTGTEEEIEKFEKDLNETKAKLKKVMDKSTKAFESMQVYSLETALEKINSNDAGEKYMAALTLQAYYYKDLVKSMPNLSSEEKKKEKARYEKAQEQARNYIMALSQRARQWIKANKDGAVKAVLNKNPEIVYPEFLNQPLKIDLICSKEDREKLISRYGYKFINARMGVVFSQASMTIPQGIKLMNDLQVEMEKLSDKTSKELLAVTKAHLKVNSKKDNTQLIENFKRMQKDVFDRAAREANMNVVDLQMQIDQLFKDYPNCFSSTKEFFATLKILETREAKDRGRKLINRLKEFKAAKGKMPKDMFELMSYLDEVNNNSPDYYEGKDPWYNSYEVRDKKGKKELWSLGKDRKVSKDDINAGVIE